MSPEPRSLHALCGFHEGHEGDWQDCAKCRDAYEPEMYVYYGTNEYNLVKLENPPDYEPTHCAQCNKVLDLGHGGFIMSEGKYYCWDCKGADIPKLAP